jgi:Ala-tRNA(Pro) deacylase
MQIPNRLEAWLAARGARYDICTHPKSRSSPETARAAHLDAHQLAKAVVLEDENDVCLVALVPADRHVQIGRLAQLLNRPHLHLADEARVTELFGDCVPGAVPALGMAWGLETVVADELEEPDAVYLECGDHEALVRLTHAQFSQLMQSAWHGRFCAARVH